MRHVSRKGFVRLNALEQSVGHGLNGLRELANFIMAIAELVGAISLSLLALTMPYLAIGVVAVLLGGLVWRLICLKQIRRETVTPDD